MERQPRFSKCLRGSRVRKILLTMSCTIFAFCPKMRKERKKDEDECLARRDWRPASPALKEERRRAAALQDASRLGAILEWRAATWSATDLSRFGVGD